MAENFVKALPRGAHDPAKFIRPKELQHKLERNGVTVDPRTFSGMKTVGFDQNKDMVFGLTPETWNLYLGYAIAN